MTQWTVILVTDDQSTIDLITNEAERKGYEVEVYRDSILALNSLYHNPWRSDLLIVDEDMTDLPGSFIAERLFNMRAMANVMLLVPTMDIASDTVTRSSGVKWVIAKPSLFKTNASLLSRFVGPA